MSKENVEIVRRAYELLNRRDPSLGTLFAKDARIRFLDWGPFPNQTFKGWDATRAYWDDLFAAVADLRMEPEGVLGQGNYVVATVHASGLGESSGVEVNMSFEALFEIRNAQVVAFEVFRTRAEALEAAGLRE